MKNFMDNVKLALFVFLFGVVVGVFVTLTVIKGH